MGVGASSHFLPTDHTQGSMPVWGPAGVSPVQPDLAPDHGMYRTKNETITNTCGNLELADVKPSPCMCLCLAAKSPSSFVEGGGEAMNENCWVNDGAHDQTNTETGVAGKPNITRL